MHALGGYRVQGKGDEAARHCSSSDALALQDAGAAMLVLELVPAALAAEVTANCCTCATIGIGAGAGCAGQVLVLHDMLGVNPGQDAAFVRNFMAGATGIAQAPCGATCAPSRTAAFPTTSSTPGN